MIKRDKLGRFVKGNAPWMKGKKHTEEIRIKIRKNMGKTRPWNKGLTKETDERIKRAGRSISKSYIKKPQTKEHREKIYFSRKNNGKPWNSEIATKKRIKTVKDKGIFKNRINPMYGKKHKIETINKIKEWRRTFILPKKDTKIEVKIQNFLKILGIEFFTHQYIKIKHSYQCDILIPAMNLVIECDGDYWHKYPVGRNIDHIRTKELIKKGFKVLRLWGFEINKMSIDVFKNRIAREGFEPSTSSS